jgi:hypothetical protein
MYWYEFENEISQFKNGTCLFDMMLMHSANSKMVPVCLPRCWYYQPIKKWYLSVWHDADTISQFKNGTLPVCLTWCWYYQPIQKWYLSVWHDADTISQSKMEPVSSTWCWYYKPFKKIVPVCLTWCWCFLPPLVLPWVLFLLWSKLQSYLVSWFCYDLLVLVQVLFLLRSCSDIVGPCPGILFWAPGLVLLSWSLLKSCSDLLNSNRVLISWSWI